MIRFGGYQPPESVHSRAAAALGRALHRRLGDAMPFEIEGNVIDAGRDAADLLGMVETGEKTMCYFSSSYLAGRVPEFALLDLPFVVGDRAAACEALDGALGALLRERLERASSWRLLGFWDNGIRHLSNRIRPLRAPADCEGLVIRTLLSELHQETFRRLGFRPRPLDVKGLIEAVRAGAVDAQDNALTNIANFGIGAFHRHVTLTGHFFGVAVVLCHAPSFDGWPDDVRAAVAAAVEEATALQRRLAAEEDVLARERLEAAGVAVVALSADERRAFREAVRPVVDAQRARLGDALLALLPAGAAGARA